MSTEIELEIRARGYNPDLTQAPKDATLLALLVKFEEHPFEDVGDNVPLATIGFNDADHTDDEEWKFAGWNWEQDHFTNGKGEVIGWKPLEYELGSDPAIYEMGTPLASIADGMTVYKELKDILESKTSITIAFSEGTIATSDYLSAAFGQFLSEMPSKKFWETFHFINCPAWLMETLEVVVDNAVTHYQNRQPSKVDSEPLVAPVLLRE